MSNYPSKTVYKKYKKVIAKIKGTKKKEGGQFEERREKYGYHIGIIL